MNVAIKLQQIISDSHSDIIHMETKGDLMGLLMLWHKSGILSIEGERYHQL